MRRELATIAGLAGTGRNLQFAVSRREALVANPGRGVGTALLTNTWGVFAWKASRGPAPQLAAALLIAETALLAVHVRHNIAKPSTGINVMLAAVALACSL